MLKRTVIFFLLSPLYKITEQLRQKKKLVCFSDEIFKMLFDISNANFQFKFPEDLDVLKTNEGMR